MSTSLFSSGLKKILLFCLLAAIFSSCATVFNRKYTDIQVKSNEVMELVYANDTTFVEADRVIRLPVQSRDEPLPFTVISPYDVKDVLVRSRKGVVYWSNIITIPWFGAGFIVDEISGKKYSYPRKVFIDADQPSGAYLPYFPMKDDLIEKKNLIGISPFAFFRQAHPMIEVSYERILNRQMSSRFTYSHFLSLDNEYARRSRGFQVSLEQKFYFRNQERTRIYSSLVLEHLNKTHEAELTFEPAGDGISDPFENRFTQLAKVRKRFVSLTPRIGLQSYLGSGFVFETFFGIGLRHRNVSHPNVDPMFRVVDNSDNWWLFPDIAELSNMAEDRISSNWDLGFRLSWAF